MKLVRYVNKEKKHSYYMLHENVNGREFRFLVNFPTNRNRDILKLFEEVVYVENKEDPKKEIKD